MKSVYIINQYSRAMLYGIGTYTQQLISVLKSLHLRVTIVTLSPDYSCMENIEDCGVLSIHIPMPDFVRYTRFFSAKEDDRYLRNVYYMLLPYISKEEELIFHFNFPEFGKLARLLKDNFTCKIVATMHYSHWSLNLLGNREKLYSILNQESNDSVSNDIRKFFMLEQEFYKDIADYVISIAKHNFDDLIHIYGVESSKIVFIPNGLKDEYQKIDHARKSKLRELFHLSDDEKLLIFVGRVNPVKGVDYLIKAFKEIIKVRDDVHLMIIGESTDDYLGICQNLTYPFYSKISFNGFVTKDILADIYSVADIGIVPSLHEEFGYVAIEMLMYGLPVISNETTGLKDIIQDNINGSTFLIQKDNESASIAELSSKIIDLLNSPEKRSRYICKGRESFSDKYDLKIFFQNMKKMYMNIC